MTANRSCRCVTVKSDCGEKRAAEAAQSREETMLDQEDRTIMRLRWYTEDHMVGKPPDERSPQETPREALH
jgi:hypothetical protein